MQLVYNLLVVLHFIGLASLLGGFLVQMSSPTKVVNPAMLHGALTQLVTGLAMVGMAESGLVEDTDINTTKVEAEVLDLKGCFVTPGLIDAHVHMGTYNEGFPESMQDANDMVDPVVPQLRILDAVYQDDTAFGDALAGGVTCVQTLPGSANIIGGQGA